MTTDPDPATPIDLSLVPPELVAPLAKLGVYALYLMGGHGVDLWEYFDCNHCARELGLGKTDDEDDLVLQADERLGPALDRIFCSEWPHCVHQSPWLRFRRPAGD